MTGAERPELSVKALLDCVEQEKNMAFVSLREASADLCEIGATGDIPMSYHEYPIGADGVTGNRKLFVCMIESFFRVIVNDDMPNLYNDGRTLEIAEFVFSQDEQNSLSASINVTSIGSDEHGWNGNAQSGPILYLNKNLANELPELVIIKKNNHRTILPDYDEQEFERDNELLDFINIQMDTARNLTELLQKSYLGSLYQIPVLLRRFSLV